MNFRLKQARLDEAIKAACDASTTFSDFTVTQLAEYGLRLTELEDIVNTLVADYEECLAEIAEIGEDE